MKTIQTLFFTLVLLLSLALLAFVFPKDGLKIGSYTLVFANQYTLFHAHDTPAYDGPNYIWQATVLAQKSTEIISPMDYKIRVLKSDSLLNTISLSPNHIELPKDSTNLLFAVFQAMEHAQDAPISKRPLHILHYGDSQIEQDRITNTLRAGLQDKFGGYGAGLIPFYQTIPSGAIGQSVAPIPEYYLAYGPTSYRIENNHYGPMAHMDYISRPTTANFYRIKYRYTKPNTQHFSSIKVLVGATDSLRLTCQDQTLESRSQNFEVLTFEVGDIKRASLKIEGQGEILGVSLESQNGVHVDNLAMRGCSGTIFRRIESTQYSAFFKAFEVPLIILQFGGNTIPYTSSKRAINHYINSLREQIHYLKRLSPSSRFLFVGPSDMATPQDGIYKSYPQISNMVKALRQLCQEEHLAFWDLYHIMGGEGSMVNWVIQGLAGKDYTHFSLRGAEKVGQKLNTAILEQYEYYKQYESDYAPLELRDEASNAKHQNQAGSKPQLPPDTLPLNDTILSPDSLSNDTILSPDSLTLNDTTLNKDTRPIKAPLLAPDTTSSPDSTMSPTGATPPIVPDTTLSPDSTLSPNSTSIEAVSLSPDTTLNPDTISLKGTMQSPDTTPPIN